MRKKAIIIGVIICVLALSGIGSAFAAGMGFSNIGILSLGIRNVPTVAADYIGYHLSSAYTLPVTVDGVYISLDQDIGPENAVSVSLRAADGSELCYYAANDVTWDADTTYLVNMTVDAGDLPTADQVYKVKVVVATNSQYN
jgi:nitrogen fixation protein FixH